jgi:hypothetical protein
MKLYLDKFQGVWQLEDSLDAHRWKLVSSNAKHIGSNTDRGSYQNDHTMWAEFGPMIEVFTGKTYKFHILTAGSEVWIDTDWLEEKGLDSIVGQNMYASPGIVKETSATHDDNLSVLVEFSVPRNKLSDTPW